MRDGADAQYMQKPYNFTTNTLKAYLIKRLAFLFEWLYDQ